MTRRTRGARMGRRAFSAALLAGCMPRVSIAKAAATGELGHRVEQTVLPMMAAHDVPGLALGVTMEGRRHVFCWGVAAREPSVPVTPDTLFEIGSLSKTFTATLAGWACARRALSLDDPASRHVPALRDAPLGAAAMLHFGTYTAGGLPLQFPDAIRDEREAMSFFQAFSPAAAPGTQRRYSNPSIALLGHATAAALGGPFAELCESMLYPRLGLERTFLSVPTAHLRHYAWGHRDGRAVRVTPGVFDAQAYGVKSTAPDMLRFLEWQLGRGGRDPLLREAMALTHEPRFESAALVQGLGWEQYPWPVPLARLQAGNAATMAFDAHPARPVAAPRPAATLFSKTGSTNGFGAYAAFVPARAMGLVLLANRNIPIPARIAVAHAVLASL
jgi:beta-lactamase class C